MKKVLLMSLPLILTACDFDDQGNASPNTFGYLVIIAIIIFVVWGIMSSSNFNKKIKEQNIDLSLFKKMGKYVGGHPEINDGKDYVSIKKEDDKLVMHILAPLQLPVIVPNSDINIADIDDITVNDATEIERKITVGRIFLVGIFALGWKKNKKHEMAFVVIDWHKGKFKNSTTFCFEGKDAMNKANTARNELIKMCTVAN